MFWLLSVRLPNNRWHHSLERMTGCPTISTTDLLTCPMIPRLLLASLVGKHLRPYLFSIPLNTVRFYCPSFWILTGDEFRSSLVQELLELHLDCSSGLGNFSQVSSEISNLADLKSGRLTSIFMKIKLRFVNGRDFLCAETAIGTISVLTSCGPRTSAIVIDAFWPCSCSVDTIDLSTN